MYRRYRYRDGSVRRRGWTKALGWPGARHSGVGTGNWQGRSVDCLSTYCIGCDGADRVARGRLVPTSDHPFGCGCASASGQSWTASERSRILSTTMFFRAKTRTLARWLTGERPARRGPHKQLQQHCLNDGKTALRQWPRKLLRSFHKVFLPVSYKASCGNHACKGFVCMCSSLTGGCTWWPPPTCARACNALACACD